MIRNFNYLFILNSSSYPLIISISSFNIVTSIFFSLKISLVPFIISLVLFFFRVCLWLNSYNLELFERGVCTQNLLEGVKLSFVFFIFSEIFFFFSFFWSYFHFFLSPFIDFNFSWPPVGVEPFYFMDVPLLNTIILLSSGVALTASHYYLINSVDSKFKFYLLFTFILGCTFSYFQWLEYNRAFFRVNDSSWGSCFFILTGFHGFHVIIGRLFLFFCYVRRIFIGYNFNFSSFEIARWYWHFVDVIWIFVYFFVYVLAS